MNRICMHGTALRRTVAVISMLVALGINTPVSGQISFNDFCDVSSLTLNGVTGSLTPNGDCVLRLVNFYVQSGSAFTTQPFSLASDASFSTTFCFRISDPGGVSDLDGVGADGLAFVVQTQANTAGGEGGALGYGGIAPSFAVEFDTYLNEFDPDGNHVGIDYNGDLTSVTTAAVAARLNDGAVFCAWVDYDGVAGTIEARLSDTGVRPASPLLSAAVDLPTLLGTTNAFVGFSAGTGSGTGVHDILSWQLVGSFAPIECGNGALDPGETCDDGNTASGDCCDATCQVVASGTPCPDDNDACTTNVCDGAGHCGQPISCDDADPCTQDSCAPMAGCVNQVAPKTGCVAGGTRLLLKNNPDDAKDKVIYKWHSTFNDSNFDLGNPTTATDYTLCLYAGGVDLSATISSGAGWVALGTKGFKFKDVANAPDGIFKATITNRPTKILIKGKGGHLADGLVPPLTLPVVAQVVNDSNDVCYSGYVDTGGMIKNDARQFKGRATVIDDLP